MKTTSYRPLQILQSSFPTQVCAGLLAVLFFISWLPLSLGQSLTSTLSIAACIASFQGLSSLKTARYTLLWASLSFILAALTFYPALLSPFQGGRALGTATDLLPNLLSKWPLWAGGAIGIFIALRAKMIHLPQLMAFFHSLVGLATSFLTLSLWVLHARFSSLVPFHTLLELSLGGAMAAITFTGSLIAGLKLQGWFNRFQGQTFWTTFLVASCTFGALVLSGVFMCHPLLAWLAWMLLASGGAGLMMVLPIGGADMPVVISLLNSCSGWATLGVGISLQHPLFIVVGSIVGFSGAVLSYTMCRGMNRSLKDVLWAPPKAALSSSASLRPVKSLSPADASFLLASARSVVVIPGYGMAAAQAQYLLRELMEEVKKKGARVRYGIHPVAGRMPGHMNVLLAEAHIDYEDIFELEEINPDLETTDVVLVIGANDIVNTLALTDPTSSIYGMPIFHVHKAKTVLFIKRSTASGYAGLDNPQFYEENTFMIFGDGKKVCEGMLSALA